MEWISFGISGIATILGVWQAFGKKMKNVLLMNLVGNFLVAVSYLMVSGFSGAAVCFTACVQVVINYQFNVRGKRLPNALLVVYALVFLAVNLTAYTGWYDLFSLAATLVYVLSMAQSSVRSFRVLYAVNSLLWILYDIMAGAYGNLVTHVILLVCTGVSIGMNGRKVLTES